MILCCTPGYIAKHGYPKLADPEANQGKHIFVSIYNPDIVRSKTVTFYHEESGQEITALRPKQLIVDNIHQAYTMTQSDDVITPAIEFEVQDLIKTNKLVRLYPDYHMGYIEYYLLRNTPADDLKSNRFVKFVDDALRKYEEH